VDHKPQKGGPHHAREGLAVILDAFSGKAIGYALSKRLDAGLTLGGLWMGK